MSDIVPIQQPEHVSAPALSSALLAGQLAESSQAMYQRDFLAYVRWAGSQEAALQPSTFARWRTTLASETTHSPNTINRMLSAVKRLLHEAAVQGYVTHQLAESFKQVDGVKVKALRSRQKEHSRMRISAADMRRMCDMPDVGTLIGLRDAALLARSPARAPGVPK